MKYLNLYHPTLFFLVIMSFAHRAFADVIMPGDNPSNHGPGRFNHEPITENSLSSYIAAGAIVIVVVVISIIILNKIRKRK